MRHFGRTIGKKLCFLVAALALSVSLLPVMRASAVSTGETNVYRLYNRTSGEHFYTTSQSECSNLQSYGWVYEGVCWTAPVSSATPVYRLYNPVAGDHLYTIDPSEKVRLTSGYGWIDEGIAFYSDDSRRLKIFRQYNPNARTGSHNYTSHTSEANSLISLGWINEGTVFYGISQSPASGNPSPSPSPSTGNAIITLKYSGWSKYGSAYVTWGTALTNANKRAVDSVTLRVNLVDAAGATVKSYDFRTGYIAGYDTIYDGDLYSLAPVDYNRVAGVAISILSVESAATDTGHYSVEDIFISDKKDSDYFSTYDHGRDGSFSAVVENGNSFAANGTISVVLYSGNSIISVRKLKTMKLSKGEAYDLDETLTRPMIPFYDMFDIVWRYN